MSKADRDAAIFGVIIISMMVLGTGFIAWRDNADYQACRAIGGDRVIDRQCVKLTPLQPAVGG